MPTFAVFRPAWFFEKVVEMPSRIPTRRGGVPRGDTIRKHCEDLGVFGAYVGLRERYKSEGMSPRESAVRAVTEMRIEERWADWRQRQTQAGILGKGVPLTPAEMKKIRPDYVVPSITRDSEVGERVLSLPEQIRWVKQELAKVRDGQPMPTKFPSSDVLYWFQISLTRPLDFDRIVLKIEAPERDAEDQWMRDGEYQFEQIERQLQEALTETGNQLIEKEAGFVELIRPMGLDEYGKGEGDEKA